MTFEICTVLFRWSLEKLLAILWNLIGKRRHGKQYRSKDLSQNYSIKLPWHRVVQNRVVRVRMNCRVDALWFTRRKTLKRAGIKVAQYIRRLAWHTSLEPESSRFNDVFYSFFGSYKSLSGILSVSVSLYMSSRLDFTIRFSNFTPESSSDISLCSD